MKLEISTFELFYFVNITIQFLFKVIEITTDISSEMNGMEAELEQNRSMCFDNCYRLELT